ncbi:hypothetical protein M378DRAFT_319912 [Amanita muscaria Koide BX008]|uniref:Uncharacterized protein n=1 Tax=Amanita muscaria (strain Koide BX008) TaxID=946122 RepID=A0A0C2WQ36_AMAMK|nr:hypothetical protein M378DRAFT_319912 [Amanita muscaria Koide BX008]
MAPFFKSSFLFTSRRRHTHKFESTPSPNVFGSSSLLTLQSHSLPNLEELRGISVSFFEELSPLLQSRAVENPSSPVLSAHVSIFSPEQSSKAQTVSPCIDVSLGPNSGTTITALGPITSLANEVPTSPAVSSCNSLATVRAAKDVRRRAANIWPNGVSLGEAKAVQEMDEAFDQVEAMLCEKENSDDSAEKTVLPDDCAYHERLISDISDKLYGLRDTYRALQAEEQTLSNDNRALMLQNETLNKELTSNGDFKLLQELDDQITKLKRAIDHIISTEMDVPVLRAANYSLQRGANASNALFLALRIAASNAPDDDPWKTIMGPQQIGYSHEEHKALTRQNAELSNEIHLMDKKYRLWKIKAQMNAKYAGYVTPSSSAISLLLHSLERAPKKWPEDVNNILDKFEDGYEIKMRAVVSPVVAPGPSGCQRSPRVEVNVTASPVATNEVSPGANGCDGALLPQSPEVVLSPAPSLKLAEAILPSTLPLESAEVVLSPALSLKLAEAVLPSALPLEAEVGLSPVLSLKLAEAVLPSALPFEAEVGLSPALSLKLAEAVLPSALPLESTEVVLPPALSLKFTEAALPSALPLESAQVGLSPALSSKSADIDAASVISKEPAKGVLSSLSVAASIEEPAQVIRRYIPGLKLFGGNGLGRAPPGLFDPPSDSEDEITSARGSEHHIDSQENSPGLEYINKYPADDNRDVVLEQHCAESNPGLEYVDEYPADGRRNPILLQSDDSSSEFVQTTNFMDRDSFIQVSGHSTPSPSVGNTGHECNDDYPANGRCNPVLRDCNDDSIEEIPIVDGLSNYEETNDYPTDGRRNPVLRDDSSSEDSPEVIPSSKLGRVDQPKSILSTIARSASSSISNLKRISSASSSIKRSISRGLKRLRQITLKPRKKGNPASAGSQPTPSHQRQISSVHAKENRMPQVKKQNAGNINAPIVPKQRTPAPSKGIYRPTISSALKTVNDPQPVKSMPNRPPKAVRQMAVESPARRVPLTDVAVRPKLVANSPLSTRQKVLNQGRKAVRSLVRLVS